MSSFFQQPLEQWVFFLLVFARTVSVVSLAPIFGANSVPATFRLGLAAVLSFIFTLILSLPDYSATLVENFLYYVVTETLIGLAIGYVSMLFFQAIQMAGHLIDVPMGFSMVNVFDPHTDTQLPIMGDFYYVMAMLLFLAVNGHHVLIEAMLDSFRFVGLGQLPLFDMQFFIDAFALIFSIGVRISTPVVAAMLMCDAAMGLLARTVPSLNAFILGAPVKIILGVLVMMLTLSAFLYYGKDVFDIMFNTVYQMFGGGS